MTETKLNKEALGVMANIASRVEVEIGQYPDDTPTTWMLAEGTRVRSGVLVGVAGSGKTCEAERIALAAIENGIQVWYLDPQDGCSSPAVWEAAQVRAGQREVAEFADALAKLQWARNLTGSAKLWVELPAYTGEPVEVPGRRPSAVPMDRMVQGPPVLVVVEESHYVFDHPAGHSLGASLLCRPFSRWGIGSIFLTQLMTADYFGGSEELHHAAMTSPQLAYFRTVPTSSADVEAWERQYQFDTAVRNVSIGQYRRFGAPPRLYRRHPPITK